MAARLVLVVGLFLVFNLTHKAGCDVLSNSSQSVLPPAGNDSGDARMLDDTVRVDPLDRLKKYRGGYDVRNKNYWSSTAFTGIYGYAFAVMWLLCGLVYGAYCLLKSCCKRNTSTKKRPPCEKQCVLHFFLLAILCTLLAITAIGMFLASNSRFNSRVKTVIDIIIDTADNASATIYETTGAMRGMRDNIEDVEGRSEGAELLTRTSNSLDSQAADIARQASKNRRLIDKGLDIVYIVTTVTISVTLVAAVAMLVLGILKLRKTLQMLIAACWILTAICWLFFGLFFFVNTFAGDTCTALESFQENPYNNSLSSILPCDELVSARKILRDIGGEIYEILDNVNENISRSYGNIIQICNPFSPSPQHEYQPWNCANTSTSIGDIPRLLRILACPDTGGETCNGGILVPAKDFNMVTMYSTSIQKLLDVYPGMQGLVECETVKDAFSEILEKHCPPLKRNTRFLCGSLVFLSVSMMALLVSWIIGDHHGQKHHHPKGGCVKPQEQDSTLLSGDGKSNVQQDDSKRDHHDSEVILDV